MMAEYFPGISMGQEAELDKERVRRALRGELVAGEDERGFCYEPAPREECERYVLEVVDKWFYMAKQCADAGRAMERVMAEHGWKMSFSEFFAAMNEASLERNDYLFEDELEELHREAEDALGKDS